MLLNSSVAQPCREVMMSRYGFIGTLFRHPSFFFQFKYIGELELQTKVWNRVMSDLPSGQLSSC